MKIRKIVSFILAADMIFSFSGCDVLDKIMDMSFGESEEPTKPVESEPEIIEPVDPNWSVTAF